MSDMHTIAMIPARYAATRFPAKLMQPLGEKTVIRHTYDNTTATGLFDEVVVVTDSSVIFEEITAHGGKAKMSIRTHESGSDRIAEAVADMDVDIVVNVQGDEPFVRREPLAQLLDVFRDLAAVDCDILTIGQYLRPSKDHLPMARIYTPKEFVDLKTEALKMGFRHVESGPLVRSSYHAEEQAELKYLQSKGVGASA